VHTQKSAGQLGSTDVVGRPSGIEERPRAASPALSEATIEDLVRVVDELDADMGAIMPRYLARLHGLELPMLTTAPELTEPLARGSLAAFRDILTRLRTQAGPPVELPAEIANLTRAWARGGGDLVSLIDLLTYARARLWEEFEHAAERVVADGEARWRVLKESHGLAAGYPGALAALTRRVFEAECQPGLMPGGADRAQLVARVLAGRTISDGELGYDLAQDHLAVIGWGRGAGDRIAALARHTRRELLTVNGPEDTVWGWLGGRAPATPAGMRALVAWQREQGGNVAFGEPAAAIEGFRAGHKQALAAHSVALATGDRVVRYDDVALLAIICRNPAAARDFVHRQLRTLVEPDERSKTMRRTLRVYLENGHSSTRTEAILDLHRNTVRRHLDGAEACLQHPIAERSAEVLLALRLTRFAQITGLHPD
jgi:hypothetical protein